MQKSLLFALCLVGATLLASCGNTVPTETDSSTPADYPSVPPAFTGLPTSRPHTKVLTQFAASAVQSFGDDGRIVFDTKRSRPTRAKGELHRVKTDNPDAQAVGTILISPPTIEAPYGFLRRITQITTAPDGSSIIETSEATLQEAIAGADLKQSEVKSSSIRVPVEATLVPTKALMSNQTFAEHLSSNTSSNPVKPRFDIPIAESPSNYCKNESKPLGMGATLNQSACVKVKLWATVDVNIGWWWIFPYLQGFGARLNGFANASLDADVNTLNITATPVTIKLPGELNYTLVSTNFGIVTFWIGPIPVVITPQIKVSVGFGEGQLALKGTASATIKSSIPSFDFSFGTAEKPVQFGFYCGNTIDNGNWGCMGINNVNEKLEDLRSQFSSWKPFSSPLTGSTEIGVNFDLSYRGKVGLEAGLYLYDALGLSAVVEPYIKPQIKIDVKFPGIPSTANARTEVYGGINGGVTGQIKAGVHLLFINFEQTIVKYDDLYPEKSLVTFIQSCWMAGLPCSQ
jgi:hypothetical protein